MTCTDVVREMFEEYVKAESEKAKRRENPTMPSEELREYNRMLAEGWQTADGKPIELERLVRAEPAWACNVIRAFKQLSLDMTGVKLELKECQEKRLEMDAAFNGDMQTLIETQGKLEVMTDYVLRVEKISDGYRQHGLVMAEKYREMTAHALRLEDKAEVYRKRAVEAVDTLHGVEKERDVASALLEGAGILTGESRTLAERIESVLRLIGDGDREIARLRVDLQRAEAERAEARANYAFMVERAANEKLDGYRELGARAAKAENERDDALVSRDTIDKAAKSLLEQLGRAEEERDAARESYAIILRREAERLDGARELAARAAKAENDRDAFKAKYESMAAERSDEEIPQDAQDAARVRLRHVAQVLIAEVGAEGPCSAVDAADKAVDHIQKLRQKVSQHEADLAVWLHAWTHDTKPPAGLIDRARAETERSDARTREVWGGK